MPDDKPLRCDCGYLTTAIDEAGLIDEIRRHAREAHGVAFTVEDALLIVLRSELGLSRGPSTTETHATASSRRKGGRS
jgi:predicted small metal-binding protein